MAETMADLRAEQQAKNERIRRARMHDQVTLALNIAKKDVERLEKAIQPSEGEAALLAMRPLVANLPPRLMTRGSALFAGGQELKGLMENLITNGLTECERLRDRAAEKLPAAREALAKAERDYQEHAGG